MAIPLIVCLLIFTLPESPRWLLHRALTKQVRLNQLDQESEQAERLEKSLRHDCRNAFGYLRKLRHTDLRTGQDIFTTWYLIKDELRHSDQNGVLGRILDLYRLPRCRNALIAGLIVMSMQQFCGVNILSYYSSTVYQGVITSPSSPGDSNTHSFALLVNSPYLKFPSTC